jgi:hypothetical protein
MSYIFDDIIYNQIKNPYHLERTKIYYLKTNDELFNLGYFREYSKQYILNNEIFIAKFAKQNISQDNFNDIYEISKNELKEIIPEKYLDYEQIKNPYNLDINKNYFFIKHNKIIELGLFNKYYDQHYNLNTNEKVSRKFSHRNIEHSEGKIF